MSIIRNVVFIISHHKTRILNQALSVVKFLEKNKIKIFMLPEDCKYLKRPDMVLNSINSKIDLILVLGGDGTFLRAVSLFGQSGIPFFGINCGNVGFLNEVEFSNFILTMRDILKGKYKISNRMMLKAVIKKDNVTIYGLNEIALIRSSSFRTINIQCFVNKKETGKFKADGIIVATPTGSTAYSLSASGPIVDPEMKMMIINPICPHTLAIRPFIVSDSSKINLRWTGHDTQAILSSDGQNSFLVSENVDVLIQKALKPLRLIVTLEYDFFHQLGKKLKWIGYNHD